MTSDHGPELRRKVAGIRIPDSRLALEAAEVVRESSPCCLLNHAFRTYLFGELLGRSRKLRYDSELLFVAAVMHDLGLTEKFAGQEHFEVDGADAARTFLAQHGVSQEKSSVVWDAIALHTSVGIAGRKRPEIFLVHVGAGVDVAGFRLEEIEVSDMKEVLQAYPRLDFANVFLKSIAEVVREKPQTAAFNFAADVGRRFVPTFEVPNFCDLVISAPLSE